MKITKQTLQLYSESENCDDGGYKKGWNSWTTPEIVKGSDYYLRVKTILFKHSRSLI